MVSKILNKVNNLWDDLIKHDWRLGLMWGASIPFVIYLVTYNLLDVSFESKFFVAAQFGLWFFLVILYWVWVSAKIKNTEDKCHCTTTKANPTVEYLIKDREYLLLLITRSFYSVDKLIVEKRHPNADQVILVFQLKNGNLRFSVRESILPESLRPKTTKINSNKVNYKNNYRLIDELIEVAT